MLASLYAFGVIWSFTFNALSVTVLRFTERQPREFKVPLNIRYKDIDLPIGLGLITVFLFCIAMVNLATKPLATIAGVSFSAMLLVVFSISERITHRQRAGKGDMVEEFQVAERPELTRDEMRIRPGNILISIRDPRNLYYLRDVLRRTNTSKQDVVVMTARLFHREHNFSGSSRFHQGDLFEEYEQHLFTKVVELAEKEGKFVSLMMVPATNVFDSIVGMAQRLESSVIVCGLSNKLSVDEQAKLTGDAWERLPEPRPRVTLEVRAPNGSVHEYPLGPHTPRLRPEDLELMHRIWLEVTANPEFSSLHHYHIVGAALRKLEERLHGPDSKDVLAMLRTELNRQATMLPPSQETVPAVQLPAPPPEARPPATNIGHFDPDQHED